MSAGPTGPASPPLPNLPRRIVLTGFMGAGKSTVGRLLAARLRWPFLDTDSLITAEHGLTVAQIFAQDGEEHFRRIEAEAIARVLDPLHEDAVHQHQQAIVALGGGAIETEAVRQLLFPSAPSGLPATSVPAAVTIFLTAPLPELLARCHVNAATSRDTCLEATEKPPVRPLLTAPEPPEDRLARRLPYYRQSHLTVDTAGIPPVAVVDRILAWLAASDGSIPRPVV
jgi:shikimate kinase